MKVLISAVFASFLLAGTAAGGVEFNSDWSVKGKRVININTVVRVNQIEVSRDVNKGKDEAHLHTVEAVETFRKAVSDAIPEAKVTWSFSWRALQDPRPNYVAIRKRVVDYHRLYGDEITFIPGAYFAPMYNSRAQTNRDIHDGLKLVGEMVGGGYRPRSIVAGFLAADNLRYLAEEENIHVAQGTIWSQYGIDNGDGDGSISYPYYPSREHACKPAQGKADFIDCVNLDGWTCDFLCARKFGFEGGGNSRTGVGPIETYRRLGAEDGLKETRAVVRSHFGENFKRNGFGWIVVNWEVSLVSLYPPAVTAALTQWLKGVREEFPDTVVPLMSEFGEAWRRENPDNGKLDYRFVQRGTGVPKLISEPNLEIRWYMNRTFRLATLRDWTKNEPETVIDFTRYDLPAKEPPDASVKKPTRNWSLVNRINQKRRRPQDKPIPLSALTEEERRLIGPYYQPLEAPVGVPDLLTSSGGKKIATAAEWEKIRAPELLACFETEEYGRRPAAAEERGRVSFETYRETEAFGGKAICRHVRVKYDGPNGKHTFPITAYIPKTGRPVPAFVYIAINFRTKYDAEGAVAASEYWPVEKIIDRGYATAAFPVIKVAADNKDAGFSQGIFPAVQPAKARGGDSWATLSAWAWGASRVLDWMETEPAIDAKHVGVVGHSRGGKTALWTGATDKRFAMACSNESGCSGAKLNHIDLPKSESLAFMIKVLHHWFCANYRKYGGREMEMPFDQHEMLALIAPRLLCVGSATEDHWCGPLGEWWSAKLASPAWELYGKKGLVGDKWPNPEKPQQEGCVSYHLRMGKHFLTPYDWDRYMDFADKHGWRTANGPAGKDF